MNNSFLSPNNLKQSKDTLISYYKLLTDHKCIKIKISELFNQIANNEFLKELTNKIVNEQDKEARDFLKKKLPAVTISGLFENSRKLNKLINYSGLMQIDFDNVPNLELNLEKLKKDPYSFAVFKSPSGLGIKVIVKVFSSEFFHLKSFLHLKDYYQKKYNLSIDEQCKDINRLLFLCYDKNIYFNYDSLEFDLDLEEQQKQFFELDCIFSKSEKFEISNRNNYIYKLACNCNKVGINKEVTLFEICEKYSSSDFTIKEIESTVNSAYKRTYENGNDFEKSNSLSLLKRVENYLQSKYEIIFNEVSNKIEYKIINSTEKWKELNENSLFRELSHANLNISMQKISILMLSDFVQKYDPFINYFESLGKWDSATELDYIDLLSDFLPVTDKVRFNKHFKKMLVRSIACALEPNVFNKQVFILVGETQNTGKSTFCRWLCPPALSEYITEYINTDKDGLISLATNFIINIDELATLQKAEINSLKSFISKDKVNIRLPFAKRSTTHQRRTNFIGSTNNIEFLTDETGSVRWLCFELNGQINFNYKRDIDINDIWKQAYTLYKSGFEFQLTIDEIKENEEINNKYSVTSYELQLIKKYYKTSTKENGFFVDATDIANFIYTQVPNIKLQIRNIGKAMKQLGFKRTTKYLNEKGFTTYGYFVEKILN